ncbi:Membrane protein insertase YidC [Candidatus Portiera aleyrodidarum]|uniref:Membrane protein insertase YidC n=1 Tax=Candidatus Portiera aleyrodidarum TaxID=91844 RepID=A0A6S6RXY9_9GAMM|nr:membrane protein insertase YidC [Candidatus Portiera aleyrodidarum]CAA3704325.1 Membrane protein insertase YidC [Candidatus Portiera aleyrodidarum]
MENIINYGNGRVISAPIKWILCKINLVIINWGFSIIILTIFIKFMLLPLSYISYKTIIKIRKIKPKLHNLENQKQDKKKITEELIKIYTKEKINPFNSCLPVIMQTPIFISLYWTLTTSIELKNSPFILWIKDLSLMDPYFILPIAMGLSILIQQKINNKENKKNNIIKILPIIFTLFFLWFPSCLLIYWITNNIMSIIQQYLILKNYEKK